MTSADDLDQLYLLLDELSVRLGGPRLLSQCHGRMPWPPRGVYFFFEDGEVRRDGTPRVVRVGTHGLKTGSDRELWQRLSDHRGTVGGQFPGGGDHRGSVFRRHVGAAMLRRDESLATDPAQSTWGIGSTAPPPVKDHEAPHEQRVSAHIRVMPFLWLPVEDPPGPDSDRGRIERGAIALLSALSNPHADTPSPTWLGNHSASWKVVGSGLWNDNHVRQTPETEVLDRIHQWIQQA